MPVDSEIGWSEAVTRLRTERTRAETCVRLLKRYGSPADVAVGFHIYGEGKAEIDGVIAGLTVALAQKSKPSGLPDLEARLERGVVARQELARQLDGLVPDRTGQKGVVGDLLDKTLGPLIEAAKDIYLRRREEDVLTRKTIETQLEGARWPEFDKIGVEA